LAWVYVGWSIVLFGAEVCHLHQRGADPAVKTLRGAPQTPDTGNCE